MIDWFEVNWLISFGFDFGGVHKFTLENTQATSCMGSIYAAYVIIKEKVCLCLCGTEINTQVFLMIFFLSMTKVDQNIYLDSISIRNYGESFL